MKILAIADRAPKQNVAETVQQQQIDIIMTLGDLGYFELKDLNAVVNIPKVGVYGNHCSGSYFTELDIQNLHLKTWKYKNTTFGGFQGCVRYKENPEAIMYTQSEAKELINQLPPVDVLIAHCPPYGINDDTAEISHTGFIALRNYIEQYQPKHFFHGHTYPTAEKIVTNLGITTIHYVFGEAVIEI